MLQKVTLQPVYVLHYRPYRDTSLLVDLFSRDYGRIGAVARGVRSARSRHRGLLQPFTPLLVSWVGKTDLVTLNTIEPNGLPEHLQGNALLSGLYINELLMRALHQGDPHPELYNTYSKMLPAFAKASAGTADIEQTLRLFEKRLLQEAGYGLSFNVQPDQFYVFDPQQGFIWVSDQHRVPGAILGDSLLALAAESLVTPQHLLDAKRLMRMALRPIIGHKPLKSRELFFSQKMSSTLSRL